MTQRIIKFRCWDLVNGKVALLDSLHFNPDLTISGVGISFPAKTGFIKEHREQGDDLILMQFTGLLDKNGKEIYEGDVVRSYCGQGEVKFGEYMAGGQDYYASGAYGFFIQRSESEDDTETLGQCEIIGNVYENPTLISHPLT